MPSVTWVAQLFATCVFWQAYIDATMVHQNESMLNICCSALESLHPHFQTPTKSLSPCSAYRETPYKLSGFSPRRNSWSRERRKKKEGCSIWVSLVSSFVVALTLQCQVNSRQSRASKIQLSKSRNPSCVQLSVRCVFYVYK